MTADDQPKIHEFHAHVYFDSASQDQARALCMTAQSLFGVEMGRMHPGPVGPHPMGSCQLRVAPNQFGTVIPWLMQHRDGLTLFIHAETGDALRDHTSHAIWAGAMMRLDLSNF